MENLKWMKDDRLQHIPASKLNFLQKHVFDTNQISDKEKLPFLLALANKAQKEKMQFSKDETFLIIDVLKDYSTKDELQKIDQLLNIFHEK